MFGEKPVIAIYKECSRDFIENNYGNMILSADGKYHSFRCPQKECGRPVKIGYPRCPFCNTKLKWEYPFEEQIVEEK